MGLGHLRRRDHERSACAGATRESVVCRGCPLLTPTFINMYCWQGIPDSPDCKLRCMMWHYPQGAWEHSMVTWARERTINQLSTNHRYQRVPAGLVVHWNFTHDAMMNRALPSLCISSQTVFRIKLGSVPKRVKMSRSQCKHSLTVLMAPRTITQTLERRVIS
jgi:hypothetical protein